MGQLQNYKDDFILLAEAGFIAINQMDEQSALKLFKASETLNPDNLLPKIGVGYMHLCKLELKQAAKSFQDILDNDPDNEMAKTFLGLSLSLYPSEVAHGERVLEESIKTSKDPAIKDLAKNSLEFVEKFVKKSPSPAQGQGQGHSKKEKK